MPESALWVHDEKNVNAAKLLADLFAPDFPVPDRRAHRRSTRPIYEDVMLEQEQRAISDRGPGDIAQAADVRRYLEDQLGGGLRPPSDGRRAPDGALTALPRPHGRIARAKPALEAHARLPRRMTLTVG